MWMLGATSLAAPAVRIRVAVTEPDIEIIVRVAGIKLTLSACSRVHLSKGPRRGIAVQDKLLKADAVVWTAFNESAAISDVLEPLRAPQGAERHWIDISKGAVRVSPTSTCFGYVDPSLMAGDPFFWLNPENGASIARAAAEGLGDMRPDKRGYFLANAEAFQKDLERDIVRWKKELEPLVGIRIFSAQCGWQNFSKLGGPTFVVCKGSPGTLPTPQLLLDHVKEMKAQIILVDPNTPPEYGRAFRKDSGIKVIEVASSVDAIPGARSYSDLFDNLVKALKEATH
jgi:ABC-type Zn uptake system ZnuABC Zn-binding protein ZnuA